MGRPPGFSSASSAWSSCRFMLLPSILVLSFFFLLRLVCYFGFLFRRWLKSKSWPILLLGVTFQPGWFAVHTCYLFSFQFYHHVLLSFVPFIPSPPPLPPLFFSFFLSPPVCSSFLSFSLFCSFSLCTHLPSVCAISYSFLFVIFIASSFFFCILLPFTVDPRNFSRRLHYALSGIGRIDRVTG